MKLFKIKKCCTAVLFCLLTSSCSVNCTWKEASNIADNGGDSRISETFPVDDIYKSLSGNKNYILGMYNPHYYLLVKRNYGDIRLTILFNNSYTEDNKGYRFSLSTSKLDGAYGAPCSTPSEELLDYAYEMIDDMPLSSTHKHKLKNNIHVISTNPGHIF